MAGLEQPSNGDAFLSPGYSVGILLQEPPLDESKTVLENVQDGAAEIMGKLDRFNEVAELMATDYSDALHGGDGQAPGGPGPRQRVGPGRPAGAGHGRAGLPARRLAGHQPLRW